MAQTLLDARDLHVIFDTDEGQIHAVNGISLSLSPAQVLGVVGESGSGKSVSMMAVMRLTEPRSGVIWFNGRDLRSLAHREMRKVRGKEIAMIFQDPMTSLNPVLTIGRQLVEGMVHHLQIRHRDARRRAVDLLDRVGIPRPASRLGSYPHEFSGGMRQRVMIAMALSCEPKLLIADEPTTALDVTVQAQILELLRDIQKDTQMAMIFISHDIGVISGISDVIAVMYGGHIVEQGPVKSVLGAPQHPYTEGLLACLPRIDGPRNEPLKPIAGSPPDGLTLATGCCYAERCGYARQECNLAMPTLEPVVADHSLESLIHSRACIVDLSTRELIKR